MNKLLENTKFHAVTDEAMLEVEGGSVIAAPMVPVVPVLLGIKIGEWIIKQIL